MMLAGNEERADAARAALLQDQRIFGDAVDAADARADHDAGRALLVRRLGLPAGILQRLVGGRHPVEDEVVDLAQFLRLQPLRD